MIKEIEFTNFRNLNGKYVLNNKLNIIAGKNNSGKTNFLEGIRLAFSSVSNDYFKIKKSDFKDSNDENPIFIKVLMTENDIPSLVSYDENGNEVCGFTLNVYKTQTGRYVRKITQYNELDVDYDILRNDEHIPTLYMIPLVRSEDLYSDWLSTGISNFIDSEERYSTLKEESKQHIKESMSSKIAEFKEFCLKFNQNFDVELTEPKITDEKVYIVNGTGEHNFCIGSGYKSIANIILNTMDNKFNIVLIDEIENHLHPSLLRTLIREIKSLNPNAQIIGTTHSPIVINELLNEEIICINGKKLGDLPETNQKKLEKFLTTGRSEIVFGENIVLVEGVTEELLLKNYLRTNNKNWTIVNVAGIMFEPYIELSKLLDKKVVVISDSDLVLSENKDTPSTRYTKLKKYCTTNGITLLTSYNTLESDLYANGFLNDYVDLLSKVDDTEIYVAKNGKKTLIAEKIIEGNIDLSNWHIIEEIKNEFEGH